MADGTKEAVVMFKSQKAAYKAYINLKGKFRYSYVKLIKISDQEYLDFLKNKKGKI